MTTTASAMMEMRQDRIALDLQSARTIDALSGHMHVAQTNISKATVNPYLGSEIPGSEQLGLDPDKTYNLLRDPEELAAAAKSFNGKPLVLAHRAQAVDDGDHENRVGSIANVTYEHPYLKADLSIWSKAAIEAIESGAQRELSCGYGYEPDMTPGEYEGVKFDGVMRKLNGNHLALVREGRAGADCHVFDSLEKVKMTKTVLSRKAVAAQGALVAYLAPKMAQDKKVDWTPTFKDVTASNYKAKIKTIAADVAKQLEGKLAKDENVELEKVAEILQAVAAVDPVEPEVVDPVDPVTEDDDDTDLVAKLVAKGYSEEEAKKIAARTPAPAAADEDDDDAKKKGDDDKKAMDELRKELRAASVKIAAMDGKIAKARTDGAADAIKTQREIFDALNHVKQWVGELPVAMDSAEAVYRTALTTLGKDVDGVHADALRPILEAQPKAGEQRAPRTLVAQDAAAKAEFDKMFPNANRLKN